MCKEGCESGGRTVEECGCVDAASGEGAGEVPHFAERAALGEGDDEADEEEDGVEGNCPETEATEGVCDSWKVSATHPLWRCWGLTKSKIGEEDGRLDAKDVDVVEHLDGKGGLSRRSDQRH